MKKKNIAFILFGVAGMNVVTLPILLFVYGPLYSRVGMTSNFTDLILTVLTVTTLTMVSILILAGIIVYFKFRKE